MKITTLAKTVLIVASLPLFAGCVERQVVYRDRPVYAPAVKTRPVSEGIEKVSEVGAENYRQTDLPANALMPH